MRHKQKKKHNKETYLRKMKEGNYKPKKLPYAINEKATVLKYTRNIYYSDRLRTQVINIFRYCSLCKYDNVNALEIHHIDKNHNNNQWKNITVLCSNYHTLLHKGLIDYWEELNRKN